jgi:putative spermidine/putrescine transport system substrate-binding protein
MSYRRTLRRNGGIVKPHARVQDNIFTRRAILAGGLTLGLAGCGGGAETTPTPAIPELQPTNTPEPVPTQAPLGSPVAGYSQPGKWDGRTLNVAAWGGNIEDAQGTAFFNPFEEATGASVQIKKADLGRLKEQVDSEDVSWDVLTVPADTALALARTGYLEPIDFAVVDKTPLVPEVVLQYAVGEGFYSTVIVYRADNPAPPRGWTDFWTFSERESPDDPIPPQDLRTLPRNPVGTLEFALLADGVPVEQLYPLDLERAFASLDRIRDYVVAWYEDGKQPIELLVADQVAMGSAWNVRAWQLGVTTEVGTQWNGGMLSADMWVVPKGAPNKDIAMDFINFSTRAIPSANFSRLVPYGPVNLEAPPLLDPERLKQMPTAPENFSSQFIQNWVWWADNLDAVTARFEDWLLSKPESSPEAQSH